VTSPQTVAPTPPTGRRLWCYRILASVLAVGVILGGLELALRIAGIGWPTGFLIQGRVGERAVWTENPRFTWRFMPPELARVPQPLLIPTTRDRQTLRILVLGESAAMGDPEPAYGFPRVLQTLLEARLPGKRVEVINAAMTAINSHVIRDIATDCTVLDADVWVVYMGNNEVTGPFGPGTIFSRQSPSTGWIRTLTTLRRTRIVQAIDLLVQRWADRNRPAGAWGGLEMFLEHQVTDTDPRLHRVRASFEENLRHIIRTGRDSGARVVVGTVAVNLRDSAPFSSSNTPGLSPDIAGQWTDAFNAGKAAETRRELAEARDAYEKALSLDDRHAELVFRRARVGLTLGETNVATGLSLARDLDTLRFRADSTLNALIRGVSTNRETDGVWLVDAERTFAANTPGRAPGDEVFWEHVHFRLPGSYLLALVTGAAVLESLPREVTTNARPDWISLNEVAQRLPVTSWSDFRITEGVRSRLARPPFTTQANAADRDQRLQRELLSLARGVQPNAFNAQADAFRKAIAQHPDDWILHDQFGRLHESFGDIDGAMESWRRVMELVPHHFGVRYQIGRMLASKDETSAQAEPHLREALALRPKTAEVHATLGQAIARQKRYPEAYAEFAIATRLRPDLLDAEVQWGIALANAGNDPQARHHFDRALSLSTNSALSHLHLARIALRSGDTNSARLRYREVLRLSPNYREAREFIGEAVESRGSDPDH
jgi:tetratricopeptide (TPR) repeat protein